MAEKVKDLNKRNRKDINYNHQDRKSDKFINIGTHNLRVVLSDIPSEYTIVLEAGGGEYSEVYSKIQDSIVNQTKIRTMSYDRSGYGQSELGPADFKAIDEVKALKKCLEIQEFENNYILVGHSYGGFLVQLFLMQYPELVKGIVLIDPMNVRFVDGFGLDNLNAATEYFENPTENHEKAGNRMTDYFPEALELLRGKDLPNETPVILITAGKFPAIAADIWRNCHQEMVKNSENHQMIIAEGNSHDIIRENPELVINAIKEMVNTIKSA